ncbi:PREDICTED: PXMP2/4 family protein 4 isoform X2 [Tarenaya hassleriana]|nr:PREDICTED: PXMP2/4 family protein 4 isoform X2 [Tarenaya hassleriana]
MDALSGGAGGLWGWSEFCRRRRLDSSGKRSKRPNSGSSDSVEVRSDSGYRFPLKQALTAGFLTLTGDTIAQISAGWKKRQALMQSSCVSGVSGSDEGELWNIFLEHDWIRALRMASYGFLLYGPGSYAWYQYLDHCLPKPTVGNVMLKVVLNQVVLGPSVIAVIFAWNNLWLGKLSELGTKYQKDALPTLLFGFRFWIPVSVLNF